MNITKINENLYRMTMPYKDIFTTVYAMKAPAGVILFDAASYPADVDMHIVPFLEELGVSAQELKYVFISHNHGDHAGGLERLMEVYPDVCIMTRAGKLMEKYSAYKTVRHEDGEVYLDVFRVVTIPGHTKDCAGLLDTRTMTLVSGDSLQFYGIRGSDDWASNISLPGEYIQALDKVSKLGIRQIVSAHDYDPFGYRADGEAAVQQAICDCATPLRKIKELLLANPDMDDAGIRAIFNAPKDIPTIRERVVAAIRADMGEGKLEKL